MSRNNLLDARHLSDNIVSVKTMTKRELSRNPAKLTAIKPGESVLVPDAKGGLMVTRRKKTRLPAGQMFAELERLCAGCPPIDTLAFLQEGEE